MNSSSNAKVVGRKNHDQTHKPVKRHSQSSFCRLPEPNRCQVLLPSAEPGEYTVIARNKYGEADNICRITVTREEFWRLLSIS